MQDFDGELLRLAARFSKLLSMQPTKLRLACFIGYHLTI
jgi:hypothetical protein